MENQKSLQNDQEKLNEISPEKNEANIEIAKSIEDDNIKLQAIDKMKKLGINDKYGITLRDYEILEIITTLKNDEKKYRY